MVIFVQLIVYAVGVMLLLLFGWIADQLTPPPAIPPANDEPGPADDEIHRPSREDSGGSEQVAVADRLGVTIRAVH